MRFLAIEHQLPSAKVSNAEVFDRLREQSGRHLSGPQVEQLLALTKACFDSTGTTVRYHRAPGEEPYALARMAGERALATAGLKPEDIDLLIYVGIGRGIVEPASANIYQDILGLRNATCFDIVDACASWLRAMHVSSTFLRVGAYKRIMILNAEFVGRDCHRYELKSLSEFAHWHPSVTIGEASTATIVESSSEPNDFVVNFRTWGEKRDLCFVPMSNFAGYFGKDVGFEVKPMQFVSFGLRLMDFGAEKLIEHYRSSAEFNSFEPDLVFGHSASDGMAAHIVKSCGNTISASVPLAMSHSIKAGRLKPSQRVLILFASAGVTTALAKFQYLN